MKRSWSRRWSCIVVSPARSSVSSDANLWRSSWGFPDNVKCGPGEHPNPRAQGNLVGCTFPPQPTLNIRPTVSVFWAICGMVVCISRRGIWDGTLAKLALPSRTVRSPVPHSARSTVTGLPPRTLHTWPWTRQDLAGWYSPIGFGCAPGLSTTRNPLDRTIEHFPGSDPSSLPGLPGLPSTPSWRRVGRE